MVRTDGSSPSQMFFGRTQKQTLPLLNPNVTSFNPEALIQKRDDLHSKRCNLRDQLSVIIADLVPGEEVLVQDYLTGLWADSATVLSMREDRRYYWMQDKHGRKFIRGRRRLKQISQPSEANQTSYSNQTNQVLIMQLAHSSSAWTLKVKLHKLPPSVASAASENPLGLNQHTLNPHENMCIFYLSDKHYPVNQPSTSKYSVDLRYWDSPIGLKPALQHYILSFEQLFCDSNMASNGLSPILAQQGLQATSSGFKPVSQRQEHSGSVVPRGVQGPHYTPRKLRVPLHRNTSRNRRGNAHLPHSPRSSLVLSANGTESPLEAPTFPRCYEEEGGGTRGSIHSGLHSGRGLSGPSGLTRGRCPRTVRLGSRLLTGHPSSTSPSPGPWVWEQSDSDTDCWSLSNCIIVEPTEHDDAVPTLTPPDFRRQFIKNWIQQRSKHSTELANETRAEDQAEGGIMGDAAPRPQEIVRHVCAGEGARRDSLPGLIASQDRGRQLPRAQYQLLDPLHQLDSKAAWT